MRQMDFKLWAVPDAPISHKSAPVIPSKSSQLVPSYLRLNSGSLSSNPTSAALSSSVISQKYQATQEVLKRTLTIMSTGHIIPLDQELHRNLDSLNPKLHPPVVSKNAPV